MTRLDLDPDLAQLGEALRACAAEDLARTPADARAGHAGIRSRRAAWFSNRRGRWLAATVAAVIAVPGIAYAAGAFTSPQTVANSLPASDVIFGSRPTCTVVLANVEYSCTLRKAPPSDPTAHLTPQQQYALTDVKVPGLQKYFNEARRREREGASISHQDWVREQQLIASARDKLLARWGFTTAQIGAYNAALIGGSAGTGPGQFKGTVEPTLDASRHINGGCRATNANGTDWNCYLGQAAVEQRIIQNLGEAVPGGPGAG